MQTCWPFGAGRAALEGKTRATSAGQEIGYLTNIMETIDEREQFGLTVPL